MKSSTVLGLGAACLAILAAAAMQRFWLPHARVADAAAAAPVATPPGITVQLASRGQHGRGSSAPQVVFADARGMTLYTYVSDTVGGSGTRAVSACVGECART